MTRSIVLALMLTTLSATADAADIYTPGQKTGKTFEGFAQGFINNHCMKCHDNEVMSGSLSFEKLGPVDETNVDLWKTIWAQVTLKEMPPKKKSKVEVIERLLFSDWIAEELARTLRDKGGFGDPRDPNKGNFLDHDLLFGPLPSSIRLVPTATEARIWRITRDEHITRVNELINKEPPYDPAKPGLRAHGDAVVVEHKGGALKLYLGTDVYVKVTLESLDGISPTCRQCYRQHAIMVCGITLIFLRSTAPNQHNFSSWATTSSSTWLTG
jgi:hypothetical protein